MSKTVRIYPVPGHFLLGVPAVVQDVDPKTAALLVEHGAFSYDPSPDEPAPPPDTEE